MLSGRLLSYLEKRKISRNGHSLSLVVIRYTTRCHSCHSLYHSLSLVVPLVVIRCHLLSFVVTRCTTRCHSLSLVVTRCTARLSFYKRSDLIYYTEIMFFSKTQWSLTCAEYVLLFSELYDVKTERSTSCKELLINRVHLYSIEKSGNT